MTNLISFRPTSAVVLAVVLFVLDALFAIQTIFYGDGTWLTQFAVVTAIALGAWAIFIHPKVLIYDEGITIVNPLITATVGWAEVDEIETRFALTILSGNAKVVAFAAPAPGRYQARTLHKTEFKGIEHDRDFGARPGDSPRTHSGVAAYNARSRWNDFKRSKGTSAKRVAKLNYPSVFALAGSLVLVIASQLLHF